jgi:DNA-binding transcriptional LysR family regulator
MVSFFIRDNEALLIDTVSFSGIIMDRLDTVAIFVEVAEQGSFVKAARILGRSTAAVSRAVATLEARLDTALLRRTTRAVTLTDDGARYLERCRHLLAEFEELEAVAAQDKADPQGLVSLTAPVVFGRLHVLPVAARFLQAHAPRIQMRLLMLDRNVSLVDEGMDVGVRLGPLQDSSLRATKVGHVTRGVYGSPAYFKRSGTPQRLEDLRDHATIAISTAVAGVDRWRFGRRGGAQRQMLDLQPLLTVTTIDAGVEAALLGLGLAQLHSYQADQYVADGRLVPVLEEFAPDDIPIHVIQPASSHVAAKTRAFVDVLAPALRAKFNRSSHS